MKNSRIELKYSELTKEDQNMIINEIKKNFSNSRLNRHENEYLRQSFINKNIPEKLKTINKIRRSGSSDMLKLKNNMGNNKASNYNKADNNIKVNKDDITINEENEKKANFIFIKDFVFKLINKVQEENENENENDLLYEIYSNNSIEEQEKIDTNENKEKYIYNELLFGFMDLISLNNKDHNEYIDYFIKILSYQS